MGIENVNGGQPCHGDSSPEGTVEFCNHEIGAHASDASTATRAGKAPRSFGFKWLIDLIKGFFSGKSFFHGLSSRKAAPVDTGVIPISENTDNAGSINDPKAKLKEDVLKSLAGVKTEDWEELTNHVINEWEHAASPNISGDGKNTTAFIKNEQLYENLSEINGWTVDFLESNGIFEKNSGVDIFDKNIFATQTSLDSRRADLTLEIVGTKYKYADGNTGTKNHGKILQALKDLAANKHPNDEAQQKEFVLQCIQGIHKWGGQGVAYGTAYCFLTEKILESGSDTFASICNSTKRADAKISVDFDKITFECESENCALDTKNTTNGHSYADLAIIEHSKYEIRIGAPGIPHATHGGNRVEIFDAEVDSKKMISNVGNEPVFSLSA